MPAQEIVTLAEGGERDVTLFVEDSNASVLVTTDVNGSPARRIFVETISGGVLGPVVRAECGLDGRCPIDDLPRGRWTLLVSAEGAALLVADLPAEEIPVQLRRRGDIVVRPPTDPDGVAYQVRLVEAATGVVVPISPWYSMHPGRSEWAPVSNRGLDSTVPEGAYRLEIFAPDGTISTRDMTVSGGGTVEVMLGE
jgi:hypothetical protein